MADGEPELLLLAVEEVEVEVKVGALLDFIPGPLPESVVLRSLTSVLNYLAYHLPYILRSYH